MRIENKTLNPVVLETGLLVGAAGTPYAVRTVDALSERDRRRYVQTGKMVIIEDPPAQPEEKEDRKKR